MSTPITQWVTRMRFASGSVFTIAAVIVALALSGCATRPPARYGGPGSKSILHNNAGHKLAVLEFGEFGSYTDPTVLMGHSFGRWIVERTVAHTMGPLRLHRPLATTPATVPGGRRVLKETVPSAAKPYVLPARPELQGQRVP